MKKSLVLAMAMALGVTASAYAANPFSDVPAGHWAYDSIDKLAAAGVIEGMGDGTYQGDKTMTRYEMAQIVAKAMAKGANVDKLAAEFADELDNLGVRVANLEKKADNVKITGTIGMHALEGKGQDGENYKLRSDITLTGQINEDWKYTAMVRNDQQLEGNNAGVGEERLNFQRAWVDGRIGGLAVKAGRHSKGLGDADIYNSRMDGIEVSYGKAVKLTAGYAQLSDAAPKFTDPTGAVTSKWGTEAKVAYVEAATKLTKAADLKLTYVAVKNAYGKGIVTAADTMTPGIGDGDWNIFGATLGYALSKNVKLTGNYLHADQGINKDSYTVKLAYKGASAAKPGSFGLYVKYADLHKGALLGSNYTTNQLGLGMASAGARFTTVGANYALAKNIVGTVEYTAASNNNDTAPAKDKGISDTLYAGVVFTF